jgi:hypothetical protein
LRNKLHGKLVVLLPLRERTIHETRGRSSIYSGLAPEGPTVQKLPGREDLCTLADARKVTRTGGGDEDEEEKPESRAADFVRRQRRGV